MNDQELICKLRRFPGAPFNCFDNDLLFDPEYVFLSKYAELVSHQVQTEEELEDKDNFPYLAHEFVFKYVFPEPFPRFVVETGYESFCENVSEWVNAECERLQLDLHFKGFNEMNPFTHPQELEKREVDYESHLYYNEYRPFDYVKAREVDMKAVMVVMGSALIRIRESQIENSRLREWEC